MTKHVSARMGGRFPADQFMATPRKGDGRIRWGRASPSPATVEELAEYLRGFVEWAEEHRRNAKALGERPAIDAHRVTRARALLKKVGK